MESFKSRAEEWDYFSNLVREHIVNYAKNQYNDIGNDPVSLWDYGTCMENMKKYVNRYKTNQRKDQNILDLFKLSHYCAIAYWKFLNEEEEKKSFTKDTISITMKEKQKIWETIGLLNSMVEGGERHSKQSKDMIDEVLRLFGD